MRKNRTRGRCTKAAKQKRKETAPCLRCIVAASLAGIGCMAVLIVLTGLLFSATAMPNSATRPAGLVIGCGGASTAGFICSRLQRENGFFCGLLCAAVLYGVLLLLWLCFTGSWPAYYGAVKLFSMLLCGALGGSFGVNLK